MLTNDLYPGTTQVSRRSEQVRAWWLEPTLYTTLFAILQQAAQQVATIVEKQEHQWLFKEVIYTTQAQETCKTVDTEHDETNLRF